MNEEIQQALNNSLAEHDYKTALHYCEELEAKGHADARLKSVKGWCFYKLDNLQNAQDWLFKGFNQDPSNHNVVTLLMNFLMERAKYRDVITVGQLCVGFHAKDRLIWHRLATAHFLLGDHEGAIIAFRRSLEVEYTEVSAFALSQPLLCQGKYEEGFKLYENRFFSHPVLNWIQCQKMPMPKWQGESLKNKNLLVWSEQGLGDSIQFSRIIIDLVRQGANVDMMLQPQHAKLQELLQSIRGIGEVTIVKNNQVTLTKPYDYHSSLMSLMGCIGLTPSTIPRPVFPYLSVPEPKKSMVNNLDLQNSLAVKKPSAINIGIVWSTALTESFKKKDFMHFSLKDKKSLRADDILPILKMDGFRFFSLHIAKSENTQYAIDQSGAVDLASCIHSFTDTAIAIDQMDLVISVDTSVAHLAGALNKPVINLLPFAADWRWQMHREDTPWYPNMRLLRQIRHDDWKELVDRLQALLLNIVEQRQKTGDFTLFH